MNNAEPLSHVPCEGLPVEEWHRILTTNLTAVHLVTQASLSLLGPGRSVATISSRPVEADIALRAHHTASEAALLRLSRPRLGVIETGWLASDLSRFVTGEVIPVDGGTN